MAASPHDLFIGNKCALVSQTFHVTLRSSATARVMREQEQSNLQI